MQTTINKCSKAEGKVQSIKWSDCWSCSLWNGSQQIQGHALLALLCKC